MKDSVKGRDTLDAFLTREDRTLNSLALPVDMRWNRRISDRGYDSPSGVLLAVGGETNKLLPCIFKSTNVTFVTESKIFSKNK